MPELSTLLILAAVVIAVVGALRFDLFGLIWREWLKLAAPKPEAPPRPPGAHGPYHPSQGAQGHGATPPAKPEIHRSGRRH